MQKIKEEDKPKLYALIALSVAVFGYFIYSYAFASNPTPPPAKPVAGAAAAAAAAGTVAAAGAPATTANAATSPQNAPFQPEKVAPPVGGRDPFMPMAVAAPPKLSPQPTAPPAAALPPTRPPFPVGQPVATAPRKLPKSLNELIYSGDAAPAAKPAPVRPVEVGPPPVPDLRVTGVVLGDPTSGNPRNVAILRSPGGEDRRFVSAGDYVGNGYTVVAVYADGIELKDKAGNRRVTIKLGQSGEKTRAK